ncbi:MAG: HAD-IA family hydrolase [Clostridia bacterium]|nr:HAD-IA family hydrolase [Clostridia bacterium]
MSNVLFDFDGTLFDTYEGISLCVSYALEKLCKPPLGESALRKFLGPPIFSSMRDFAGVEEENVDEAVRLFRERYVAGGVLLCKPYDGIKELLAYLKERGVTLCIASSKPQFAIELLLREHGMTHFFDRICGASGAEKSEDKSKRLREAMTQKDAVMVGDRKFDIAAAKKTGLRSVGVLYGFGSKEELREAGADALAEDTEQLKGILCGMLGIKQETL